MFKHEITLRVRYGETDKMGQVYYGNYALYYEQGRTEAIRSLGLSYRALEDSGIMLPVVEFHMKFKKPAYYDDELRVVSVVKEIPDRMMCFHTEIFRGENELINLGTTRLIFLDAASQKPGRAPAELVDALKGYL